ncbi:MAG TPA: hypothetical protein VKN76_15880 [Kiloniellaceae bacterium]|nr:hypothetical protein [Kiloniellaceae bacterium]
MFLLSLPILASMLIAVLGAALLSVVLYFVVHPFWAREPDEDTKKIADNIAMRIGVVYAVVVGMMFANVRIEHVQMVQAIESEASALVRLHFALAATGGEEAAPLQKDIAAYTRFIVEEQWPALREARALPAERGIGGRDLLAPVWDYALHNRQDKANANLVALLDEVEHYRALRLFDTKGNLLPVFWYIALLGYVAILLPLYVYPPTLRRCALISLYSGTISVVLLGIFVLSHPYSPAAGVEPDIFQWLVDAGGT